MNSALSVIRGTNTKPASSDALVAGLVGQDGLTGTLFVGYPVIGTTEGRYSIDALLVSPEKGLVVFDLIEGTDPGQYDLRQDDYANKLEARLRTHRELVFRRDLLIPITPISFAPALKDVARHAIDGYPLATTSTLVHELQAADWDAPQPDVYGAALSAIQSISTIRKSRTKRTVAREDSRGAKLKSLEDSIATLDNLQAQAVVETVEGVQRIRGLAGSGKTIVLALKAAYLHAQHPDWRIAVTFNTRSLKGQFRRLINNFSLEQTGEEPDWENLRIINAWGAPGPQERDGIYHEFCRAHDIPYLDFRAAKAEFGQGREFAGACERAIAEARTRQTTYQAILVDEAQDFPATFLRLCYELLDDHRRLVYAYDELQNLSEESLPSPEDIFGVDAKGNPRVRFEAEDEEGARRDIILQKCYRNSRPILVTAHSLGFGIYRPPPKGRTTGLVQMFDQPQLWEEIGYRRRSGELRPGSRVVLFRSEEASPRFLESHSTVDDLVLFKTFSDDEEQVEWLVESIRRNLEDDELRHDDIVVINPDPLTTRTKVGTARRRLLETGISSHLAGVDTDPDIFFQPDAASVTFTGIYRAKGNEAGMVYVLNAQDCHSSAWNLATIRNRLFTAITRSKAWVRVLGIGDAMTALVQEYETLRTRDFELHFTYPTKEQREQLKIVHRDMTAKGQQQLKSREKELADLVAEIEAGRVHVTDLDNELLARLKVLLEKSSR